MKKSVPWKLRKTSSGILLLSTARRILTNLKEEKVADQAFKVGNQVSLFRVVSPENKFANPAKKIIVSLQIKEADKANKEINPDPTNRKANPAKRVEGPASIAGLP